MFLDSPGGIFCLLCCGSLYPQQLTMAVLLVLLSGLLEFLGGGSGSKIYQPTRKLRLVSREYTRISVVEIAMQWRLGGVDHHPKVVPII